MGKKIVFIGAGNMAEAVINALLSNAKYKRSEILASDINGKRLAYIRKKYGVAVEPDPARACAEGKIVLLAVKPQQMEELLSYCGRFINKDSLVISIAAGITTKFIENYLPEGTAVVRVMPNTPALVSMGAAGISKGKSAGKKALSAARGIFASAGLAVIVPESKLNAVTALSGSGPAYIFYVAQLMEEAGLEMGLDGKTASELARQTIAGAAAMLRGDGVSARELRMKVTSPGGTTEAAVKYMQENKLPGIFKNAMKKAKKRAGELAR
ncbi:MAG TPA: pyrroline-5-carboxylate reductase [Elusimicrobia bacterium]|nr:MAG: pyrroline-5-carboxylate reductase [Elusimicrobia bacterium RIFOXYA12_FULL_49_49]OGS11088.1 MAG: pyrroline-5-carboxylate reductase [Elusimicrobia bacterium RIFOXYB1_FULL_48_9]OGS15803.1 MAG: pyrroline-5-carboxylate reductase [Elusimicrobia bacterium RIFOXYA2_FULL_47_53]OGS25991.1 MAG: pyrroline-5-carboxylate reductase [Elusimicrobia bacterium RIFOXYB12_FULL_50_12]OGS31135.1 MAG: pyrroline-5-carboxylate reductase [Elusimicrobia bacterium RIFOXYB2_FULL_46_23]HBU69493.1 pyrroline-5-carboxy